MLLSRIDPNTDKLTKYYSKPTEQKAYMNQLREFMYANKMIDTRDQIVTPDLIKQAISKLPKGMQSIKKASEQFKSMRSYTKWFNTIPLLGVGMVLTQISSNNINYCQHLHLLLCFSNNRHYDSFRVQQYHMAHH